MATRSVAIGLWGLRARESRGVALHAKTAVCGLLPCHHHVEKYLTSPPQVVAALFSLLTLYSSNSFCVGSRSLLISSSLLESLPGDLITAEAVRSPTSVPQQLATLGFRTRPGSQTRFAQPPWCGCCVLQRHHMSWWAHRHCNRE